MNLLSGQTQNGSSDVVVIKGKANFYAVGAFGLGTLRLEALAPDGTTFVVVPGTSLTSDGVLSIDLPPTPIRATLTGATSPNLSAWIEWGDDATHQAVSARVRQL